MSKCSCYFKMVTEKYLKESFEKHQKRFVKLGNSYLK